MDSEPSRPAQKAGGAVGIERRRELEKSRYRSLFHRAYLRRAALEGIKGRQRKGLITPRSGPTIRSIVDLLPERRFAGGPPGRHVRSAREAERTCRGRDCAVAVRRTCRPQPGAPGDESRERPA